jgi:hypothetical protein
MRSVRMCAVMLACTAAVVAQSPQTGGYRRGPARMSPDQVPRQGALLRSAPANSDVRPPSNTQVPPEAPIVTVEGVCDRSQISKTKECKTVITRAQMESMMDMLVPGASQAARRQFAINYARLLAASAVAEQKHLEKNPEVVSQLQAQLKYARMQVLAHTLYQQIEKQAESASISEVHKYYEANLSNFDQGEVLRLSLPRSAPTTHGRPLDDSVVKAKAEELRQRAAAGEDFGQLQHDAYDNLGIKGIGPPTKLNMVRRTNLPPEEGGVFDLQPGEVTPVLESLGSLVVLKLVSKQSVPLETAQLEIKSLLRQARVKQELDSATKTVKAEFNLKYLDIASAPQLFPAPGEAQQSARSGASSDRPLPMMSRQGVTSGARRALHRPRR